MIAPEVTGHGSRRYSIQMDRIPLSPRMLFRCHFDTKAELIAGGRESKEGKQTIFLTPLNPFGDTPDGEEPSDDSSKSRKVHYHSEWKSRQDAIHWINSAGAQDKGLQFWQTRSSAIIVCMPRRLFSRMPGNHSISSKTKLGARRGPRYPNKQPRTTEHLETDVKY